MPRARARRATCALLILLSSRAAPVCAQESTLSVVESPESPDSDAQPPAPPAAAPLAPAPEAASYPSAAGAPAPPWAAQGALPAAPRRALPPGLEARWRHARNLGRAGTAFSLLGGALTLSGVLYVAVTGYPCNPDDPIAAANPNNPCNRNNTQYQPPKPTDAVPLLGYLGASSSALAFILSASGLGYQHHLLAELGADPGRGVFYAGTAFGLLGFVAVGTSYFIGLTDLLSPRDQALGTFGLTLTSTLFSVLAGVLYFADAARTQRAFDGLIRF